MVLETEAGTLSESELRALVPQLQLITERYKRAERIQKALFDISELASSVGDLPRLYTALHDIIAGFMHARNFYVAFYNDSESMLEFVYFIDEFDELTVSEIPTADLKDGITGYVLTSGNHLFLTKENFDQRVRELGVKNLAPIQLIGLVFLLKEVIALSV